MATGELPDRRTIAVSSGGDRVLRVWDLTTGQPIGEPLTGHTDWVRAVATGELPDGRTIAVSGADDRVLRVWDLTTGHPIGDPSPATPPGCGRWRPVSCRTGAHRGLRRPRPMVRVWDLTTGHPIGDPSPATPTGCGGGDR